MADVSRAGLPSSSSKHIYDGVFSSSKVKSTVFASFNDDDYGEIFGCSKSDNGGWQSSSCSIPVVELPVSEQRVRGVRGIEMDYGGVFGGFSDEGLSLMNGDELCDQLKKKARTSPPVVSVSRDKSKEQTKDVTGSHIPTNSRNVEPSMDDISKSSDGFKQNKQKTNDMPLQEVQNSRTLPVVKPLVKADTQFNDDMPIRETHSGNLTNQTNGASHEVDSSHKAPISETPVVVTDTEVEVGINVVKPVVKPVVKADTQFDGDMPIRKIHSGDFINQTNGASHEVDSSHNAPISESDTEFEVDINVATKGKHPDHSSLNIGVNEHKSDVEFDAENNIRVDGFSNSDPKIHNSKTHSPSHQESGLSSSSSVLHRHSRMTSLDLGRHVSDHDDDDGGGFRRKSRLGSSYSFDGSNDPSVARVKVQSSKVIPSLSEPHFYHMESRYKISANSKSGIPLPSLDDQLDANSLAAISASALQRAIEEAEMQIRLAKEFLERESRGCTKLRFKDTLKGKVSVMKENKHVNEINNVKKKNTVEGRSHVVESVVGTTRFVPVVEDRKKFLEESITGENANAPPESIEEGGNNEGGEWEATKHLNQIITGVKNRLASFITWQVETEKKQPHSSEYGGRELKENDENQNAITTDKKSEIEENITGISSRRIESEEKVGGLVDSTLDTKGSTSTNFSFFAFKGGRSDTEKKESQTSEEIETEIELKGDEANVEIEDDNSVSRDYGERLINSIFEECVATMKEHYPMEAHEMNQFIHEDDDGSESNREANRAVDVGHRDGRVIYEESDEEGAGDKRVIEESEDDGCGSILEAVNEVNEEYEADDGARVNEECGDDTDTSFHEVDDETTKNEEYASIHKEGYDRTVLEEHGDDRSRSSDEAENRKMLSEQVEIEDIVFIVEDDNGLDEIEVFEESEDQPNDEQLLEKIERATEERSESPVKERDECAIYDSEGLSRQMNEVEEDGVYQSKADHVEDTTKKDADQAISMEVVDKCLQMEDVVFLSKAEESVCRIDGGETEFDVENGKIIENNDFSSDVEIRKIMEKNDFASDVENGKIMEKNDFPYDVEVGVGTPVPHDEEREEKLEITNHSSEPEIGFDRPILLSHTAIDCIEEKSGLMHAFAENSMKFDGIERHKSIDLECESIVLPECETNVNSEVKADVDDEDTENGVELDGVEHHNNIDAPFPCENSTPHDCDTDVDFVQKGINDCKESELKSDDLSANQTEKCSVEAVHRRRKWFENGETVGVTKLVVDDDILLETDLVDDTTEAVREGDSVLNQRDGLVNVETAHKRRRWFVKRGDEGAPDPPSLFEGVKVSSSPLHHEVDEVVGGEKDKPNVEATPRRKRWFESVENVDPAKNPSHEDDTTTVEITQDKNRDNAPTLEEKNDVPDKVDPVREIEEETRRKRDREREKERIAVERAIREARERAFAEAKERAKRDALERPQIRVTCQKPSGGEGNSGSDRASMEAKIRAERAAVERATAEVRERALQKALSEKASQRSGRYPPERSSSLDPKYSSSSHSRSSDPLNNGDKFDGTDGESAQRRKARLERQNRTMERAAKALEEKNKRDLLVQKEQAARNILADALDTEVKRWSTGKEGNVRALLSTLQYILGSDSGWQAVSLTDLIAPTAVRKAYKKATLCVHPDKLQQRGATIQQKYICEKVFDLLKDAWSRFNPEER